MPALVGLGGYLTEHAPSALTRQIQAPASCPRALPLSHRAAQSGSLATRSQPWVPVVLAVPCPGWSTAAHSMLEQCYNATSLLGTRPTLCTGLEVGRRRCRHGM